ncbi:MAG: hypothetical protein OHK0039_36480 [Bacteroidia bacterium]
MTGLYPGQTTIQQNAIRIRERLSDVQSLSQRFMEAGYRASRIGKIYHYNNPGDIGTPGRDDPPSWHVALNPIGRDKFAQERIFTLKPGSYGGTLSWMADPRSDGEYTDGKVATETAHLLRYHRDSGQPFFLGVGFYRPHTPYVSPTGYFARYDTTAIQVPQVPPGYLQSLPPLAQRSVRRDWQQEQHNLPRHLAVQAIQAYYAAISYVDA